MNGDHLLNEPFDQISETTPWLPRAYQLGRRARERGRHPAAHRRGDARAACIEQGSPTPTVKQIARRADVSVGTVYHHFPSYDDVIRACGQLTFAIVRPPTDAIFAGCPLDPRAPRAVGPRAVRLLRALPRSGEHALRSQEAAGPRPGNGAGSITHLAALVRQAVAPAGERLQRMARALTDVGVYRTLTSQGLSTSEARRPDRQRCSPCGSGAADLRTLRSPQNERM
mgnify:CR=1 FL=1